MKTTNNTNTNTTDRTNLHNRILRQYTSLEDFADRTGVNLAALTGKDEFILEDIVKTRIALHLADDETKRIFFPDVKSQEAKHTMIDLLALRDIIERLEDIESGLTALNLMETGKIKDVGDTVSPEDFNHAFSFLMVGIMDKLTDLRAELTGKYFLERERNRTVTTQI